MPRSPKVTATLGEDGLWHVWVPVGVRPNGRIRQRHVKRAGRDAAENEAKRILAAVEAGRRVGKHQARLTVLSWMETYLDNIAPERCGEATIYDYRSKLRNWVYPQYGPKPLTTFAVDDLDAIYARMRAAGKAPSHRLKVHRIMSRALDVAKRRGHVEENVAKLMDAPTVAPVRIVALDDDTARAVIESIEATAGRRNRERWSLGFALGLRQGEALGLRWRDDDGTVLVDLDAGVIRVWYQLRRYVYQHGCGGTCGRKRGGSCPQRRGGGLRYVKCKGKSARTIPIPPELIPDFRQLRRRQAIERVLAKVWPAGEAVFTTADGRVIDPRDDYDEWGDILRCAGVGHVKPHIMRHTAATYLLRRGVEQRYVQELLGHADSRTTAGYTQDVNIMLVRAVKKTVLRPKKTKKPKIKGVEKGVLKVVE
jgi:integrase